MKWLVAFLSLLPLVLVTVASEAVTPREDLFLKAVQLIPGTPSDDFPVTSRFTSAAPETVWFGGHDGAGYALEGGVWDFDTEENGGAGFQGWYGVDETENFGVPWGARVTSGSFTCPDDAPMIDGTVGQLWFGKHLDTANAECWACDAGGDCSEPGTTRGYANDLCQRADRTGIAYSGGDVGIEFDYFLDCEGYPYDYVTVQLIAQPGDVVISVKNLNDDPNQPGLIGSPDAPAAFSETVPSGEFPGGTTSFDLRFEFVSDVGWSDEDAGTCSTNGPFGCDNIVVGGGASFSANFDTDDEGFTFSHCPGVGNFVDIRDVSIYDILDPCRCKLEGSILSFHDENFGHPDGSGGGQFNAAVSPIIDRTAYPAPDFNDIFCWFDIYAWLPHPEGTRFRLGVSYYPWECPQNGEPLWSPRSMDPLGWRYVQDPSCFTRPDNFLAYGVPGNADYYRVWLEVASCCACFGIEDCTGNTNETPLMDNIRFGLSGIPDAPVISFGGTGPLQDGFAQDGTLDPESTGRMDAPGVGPGVQPPYVLSDLMAVSGPVVGGETPSWEALLHFKVTRKGPGQDAVAGYIAWRNRVIASDGTDPEVDFVSVAMDSMELDGNVFSNSFCSMAHELDPFFNNAFADHTDENEILPDNVFTAGTSIDYYMTADYDVDQDDEEDSGNDYYRLPSTGEYEVEILPSMRTIPPGPGSGGEVAGWPCLLYLDAYNRGAQTFIDPALDAFLPEIPPEDGFPDHDRYDMYLSGTNYNANSIYRLGGPEANNGATLVQLLGYRAILLNTGRLSAGAMEESDMIGFEDWLRTTICGMSGIRQGFIANGDEIATIIQSRRQSLLTETLGAGLNCSPYRAQGCPSGADPDSSYCVELIGSDGAAYGPVNPYAAFGSGCPNNYTYSVLFATSGTGNRDWFDFDGKKGVTSFAQVVNDASGGLTNYRTVIDGYSYGHITESYDPNQNPVLCEADSVGRVQAAGNEIISALTWIFGTVPEFCTDPCVGADAPEIGGTQVLVNRLYQNEPNPFNPRTAITFSMARKGAVELSIYDVAGRLVRRLVDEPRPAGLHTTVWDGLDDQGHVVGSGVYWSQLRVEDYVSNKKMVLLK